jgi:hypothetical protein
MANYGLQRLIIRTSWENLEWIIHNIIGEQYPSLKEFGLNEKDTDFATFVQKDDAGGGIAFLKSMLEENAQTEWVPTYWHIQEVFTHPNGVKPQKGKFVIETYNKRVQLVISYHHHSFWVDVRYADPTLHHIKWYTKHKDDNDMKVWCVVVHPDKSESGLPLEDLPAMVKHWNCDFSMPIPKQYPFVGMGL